MKKIFNKNNIKELFQQLLIICFFIVFLFSCIERNDKTEFRAYEVVDLEDDIISYLIFQVHHDYPYEYIKIYECKPDAILSAKSVKFRQTKDTLFLCKYKGDKIGKPYLIKDSSAVHLSPFLYSPIIDCESTYLGDTLMNVNGKELVIHKFKKSPKALDFGIRIEYYDSSYKFMGSESIYEVIHLMDTVPDFLKRNIDFLSCENGKN